MGESTRERIVIIGYGWVGQANALALSRMGYDVSFHDTAENPIFHYDVDEEKGARITRTESLETVDGSTTWYVVCVGDRVSEDGVQDISLIKKATDALRNKKGRVVLRSTVLPQKLSELHFHFYMPEFLHEKNAVEECLNPFYFVLGMRSAETLPAFMRDLERRSHKVFRGTPEEASYVKYLSNIWNSVRIAFVNEMGDSMGNPETKEGVKKIERILDFVLERKSYLRYGQSFDGHCLPKDTRAYIGAHRGEGRNVDLLAGAYTSNESHKKIQEKYQSLPKVFSFWEYDRSQLTLIQFVWYSINQVPLIKKLRKNSRFIMDTISRLIPDRSLEDVKHIWERKARENPLYFSNMRTRSGAQVTDEELRSTGKSDYERHVLGDISIAPLLNQGNEKCVLDFGSGVGRMTEYFADHFGSVHGVDISETMTEHARTRLSERKNIILATFDGKILPYEPESFDLIFSYLTLQHVPTREGVKDYLKAFNFLLKDGGIAKIQLRGGRSVKKWEWSYGVSFTPEEAVVLAEEAGFTVLNHQVEGVKNLWLTLRK